MFAGNFAPAGWMTCDGQLLPISEYDTLFNLIGTTYGGDGQNTFALPNLAAVHRGARRDDRAAVVRAAPDAPGRPLLTVNGHTDDNSGLGYIDPSDVDSNIGYDAKNDQLVLVNSNSYHSNITYWDLSTLTK